MGKKAMCAKTLNQNEKMEIVRYLQSVSEEELANAEAEQLLEAELKKAVADMNTAMVAELLELIEPDAPDGEVMHSSWNQLEGMMPVKQKKRPKSRAIYRLGKVAASVMIIGVLVYASCETAKAFQWQSLQRRFDPEAETFTLSGSGQPEIPAEQVQEGLYGDSDAGVLSEQFADLADFPETYAGFRVKPTWMPERFTYLSGSLYADTNMEKTSIIYRSDREACIVTMTLVDDQQMVSGFDDRQLDEDSALRQIGGAQVMFSRNDAQATLSASWAVDRAQFSVSGNLTEAEVTRIVEGLVGQPGGLAP